MSLTRNDVYIVFVLILLLNPLGSYYISNNASSWLKGTEQCKAATPEVIPGERNGYTVKILGNFNLQGRSVWSGYYQTDMAFEYIGCVKLDDIPYNEQQIATPKDRRFCYPKCDGFEAVAVTEDKCYCLKSLPCTWDGVTQSSHCNIDCTHPHGVACGGIHRDTIYASIYKLNADVPTTFSTDDSSIEDTNEACLSVNLGSNEATWTKCGDEFAVACTNDNGDLGKTSNKKKTWSKAAEVCFNERESNYPLKYSERYLDNRNSKIWTGAFKMDVILSDRTIFDIIIKSGRIVMYGILYQVTTDQEGFDLKFITKDQSVRMLCEDDGNTHTQEPEEVKKVTTPLQTPTDSVPDTGGPGVAIAISITLVVLAIVIVVAAVLVRKRFCHSNRFGKMTEATSGSVDIQEYAYPDFSTINRDPDQTTSDNYTDVYNYPECTFGNAAFDASTISDESSQVGHEGNKSNKGAVSEYEYSYGSYERSGDIIDDTSRDLTLKDEEKGASYNKMEIRESYDKIKHVHVPCMRIGDVSEMLDEQSDPERGAENSYDVTSSTNTSRKHNQNNTHTDNVYNMESSIYNATNKQIKLGKTDQLYGTKQMERFRHILKPSDDHTYNKTTVNRDENIDIVTDQPYAKLTPNSDE